jgi:hypothetical protein
VYLLDPATLGRFLNAQTKVFCLFSCAPPAAAAAMTRNINYSQHNDTHCKHGHYHMCCLTVCRIFIVVLSIFVLSVVLLLL